MRGRVFRMERTTGIKAQSCQKREEEQSSSRNEYPLGHGESFGIRKGRAGSWGGVPHPPVRQNPWGGYLAKSTCSCQHLACSSDQKEN